ncbi:nSTAND1 domain-containing NTPase [Actinokineospora sp. 24-640]
MPRSERPLGSEDTALLRFAADLRRLRERAGKPTYRELGRQANYSAAALSEAAGGRRLPSRAVTLAFVRACGGDTGEWDARWRSIAADDAPGPGGGHSPYVGLGAYQIADADRFFGREAVTETLIGMLATRRFVGVFGPSGSGKSSVLRAGLAASAPGRALVLTPGSHPVLECALRLAELTGGSAAALRDELAADPANLHLLIRQSTPDRDLLLVVDQFEEVFTLCPPAERDWLIQALTIAATARPSRARVVIGVRADFHGHCGRHPELAAALRGGRFPLGPLSPDELRRAITEPAAQSGAVVEAALLTRLVSDVAGGQAALPLVSHAMAQTWRRRRGLTLSLAGYERAGGVEHATARRAEEVHGALTRPDQHAARLLFLRLVTPGENTEDTPRRVPRRELDTIDSLVDRLAAARLVTLDHDSVELAHDGLIRSWPRLRDWLAEDRETLRVHRRLTAATDVWEAHGRDADSLYRGVHLDEAAELGNRLTARERDFLAAGVAAQGARRAADHGRARRLRQFAASLVVLVLVLAGTGTYAVLAQRAATAERNTALALRAAGAATALAQSSPRSAVSLALAAYRVSPSAEAVNALRVARAAAGITEPVTGFRDPDMPWDHDPRGRVAISQDWATSSMRLWTIDQDKATPKASLAGNATAIRFSPDGRVVLLTEGERRTRVVDVTDPGHPRVIATVDRGLHVQSMSGSGKVLAGLGSVTRAGGGNQAAWPLRSTAMLWRITASGGLVEIPLPVDRVDSIDLRPDGRIMAVVRRDDHTTRSDVEIWRVDGGAPRRLAVALSAEGDLATHFSPDGRFLAVVNRSSDSVRILELTDLHEPKPWADMGYVRGHVATTEYAVDSQTLVIGRLDSVHLWDTATRGEPQPVVSISGYGYPLTRPRYHPGTKELFLTAPDGALWRFDLDDTRLLREACERAELADVDWALHFPGLEELPLCPRPGG